MAIGQLSFHGRFLAAVRGPIVSYRDADVSGLQKSETQGGRRQIAE